MIIIAIIDIILTFLALISPYIIMYIIKHRKKCNKCGNNLFTWNGYKPELNNLYNNWKCNWIGCNHSIRTMEIKDYYFVFTEDRGPVPSMRYNLKQRIKKRIRVWYCRKKGKANKGGPLSNEVV